MRLLSRVVEGPPVKVVHAAEHVDEVGEVERGEVAVLLGAEPVDLAAGDDLHLGMRGGRGGDVDEVIGQAVPRHGDHVVGIHGRRHGVMLGDGDGAELGGCSGVHQLGDGTVAVAGVVGMRMHGYQFHAGSFRYAKPADAVRRIREPTGSLGEARHRRGAAAAGDARRRKPLRSADRRRGRT